MTYIADGMSKLQNRRTRSIYDRQTREGGRGRGALSLLAQKDRVGLPIQIDLKKAITFPFSFSIMNKHKISRVAFFIICSPVHS